MSLLNERAPVAVQPRIFISYRRQDTQYQVAALHGILGEIIGADHVFTDVDSILPGDDFIETIETAVASCDVLLAVIGDRWLATTDGSGGRRLDDPTDFVHLEISTALRRGVRVIPVLLGATLPGVEQLPDGLAGLARRQAVELRPRTFAADARRLAEALVRIGGRERQRPDPPAAPLDDPWQDYARDHAIGQFVPGTVTELISAGARVRVADGVVGLMPVSELAGGPVTAPGQVVRIGDAVVAKVLDVDPGRRRVLLSLKQANEGMTVDTEFDPTRYGFAADYDDHGDYVYPAGFDVEAGQWRDGFDTERAAWERGYEQARAVYTQHIAQVRALAAPGGGTGS